MCSSSRIMEHLFMYTRGKKNALCFD
jgi:hypothetical protein